MFYNYQEFIVCMLLLPVMLYIILPLAMLVVWFLKQLVMGKKKHEEAAHPGQEDRFSHPTS